MDRIFDAYNGTMGAEFMHKTRERLHWICSQVWGSRVLDVGCSQGVVPIILARMGYAADGLDINPEAIAFANEQLAKEPGDIQSKVTYASADFARFVPPKDRKYDVITMSEVLEHLVRPQDFVRKAFSILPEKGRLIVTVPFGINDDPDHRQTFYLTSIYSLIHPLFEVAGVKIFDGWIGLVGRRRAEETKDPPSIPLNFMRQAEDAFFKIERPLRDGTLAVRNQRQALKAEQEKLAEDLRAAEKARLEAEARVAAADATPLRSELADVRGQLSASEGEKQALQTSLEVERKASAGLQDQVSMLKAMLQFATSRPQDNSQETRLLECSQEVRDLRTTLDQKRDEIAERAEQIGRLNGRIEYFEEANKHLLAERDKFQSDCESSRARVSALESELGELRRTFEAETEQYKRAGEATQERLRSIEAELAETERTRSEAESKFTDEARAHQESLAKVDALGEQVKEQSAHVAAQEARIKELDELIARGRSWEKKHRADCEALVQAYDSLRVNSTRKDAENGSLSSRLSELQKKLEKTIGERAKFSTEAYGLKMRIAAYDAKLAELKMGSEKDGEEIRRLQKCIDEASVKLRALQSVCETEKKLHAKFSSEAYCLKDLVKVYKKKLQDEKAAAAAAARKSAQHMQKEQELRFSLEAEKDELAKEYEKLAKSKLGRMTLAYWRKKDKMLGRTGKGNK